MDYRNHPAIANSDLKYLSSPKKFKLYKDKKLEEEPQEDYEKLGTLIDLYLLDKKEFEEKCYVVTDTYTKPSSPNQHQFVEAYMSGETAPNAYLQSYKVSKSDLENGNYITKAGELYGQLKRHIEVLTIANNKTIVSAEDYMLLSSIEMNVFNHAAACKFLMKPDKGWEVIKHLRIVDVPYFDIKWKGELDLVIIDHINEIVYSLDLKSTSFLSSFPYQYRKYRYERQQALYEILLKHYISKRFPDKNWVIKTRVIAIETNNMNEIAVIPIPNDVLEKGREQLIESAAIIKWHQDNNLWDYPISYYQNEGLQLVDWENVYTE